MNIVKYLSLIALVFATSVALSREGEFFVGPEYGDGVFTINKQHSFHQRKISKDGFSAGLVFGYHWENNVIMESSASFLANGNLFGNDDDYDFDQLKALIGYSFEAGQYFRIVPMIGVNHWALDTHNGKLLPATANDKHSGTDFTYKVNVEAPVGNLVILYLSYGRTQYDFGDTVTRNIGVKFEF